MKSLFVIFALWGILCFPAILFAWPGNILSVPDGDTVLVAPSGDKRTPVSVRLYGVDAPELGQAGGPEARDWLVARLPKGTAVEVVSYSQDRYGRVVALIQRGKKTVNGEMVAAGHAWVYRQYCKSRFCREWEKSQKKAKADQLGLWSDPDPMRPDKWRRKHPRK